MTYNDLTKNEKLAYELGRIDEKGNNDKVMVELQEASERIINLKELLDNEVKGHSKEWNKARFLEVKLHNTRKELINCLKDSNEIMAELEGSDDDVEGKIKDQLNINQKWIRYFTHETKT